MLERSTIRTLNFAEKPMKMPNAILLGWSLIFIACNARIDEKEARSIGAQNCARQPEYIGASGIPKERAALSSSLRNYPGLALVDVQLGTIWRHDSWDDFGHLGLITTDESGNSYVSPIPVINTLEQESDRQIQNTIFKVDSRTAELSPWLVLPGSTGTNSQNPYGILGLLYDCHGKYLFVSTVAGSDRDKEIGKIYSIDTDTKEILDVMEGMDVLGLGISGITGKKLLLLGRCRSTEVHAVEIAANGKFIGNPELILNLAMLGPKGDDRAKKIEVLPNGFLQVKGVTFYYNLTAPTEIHETKHLFKYHRYKDEWEYNGWSN